MVFPNLRIIFIWWTPHPVIGTIRDSRDYIRALLHSYYTTITEWGVLLRYTVVKYDKKMGNPTLL